MLRYPFNVLYKKRYESKQLKLGPVVDFDYIRAFNLCSRMKPQLKPLVSKKKFDDRSHEIRYIEI